MQVAPILSSMAWKVIIKTELPVVEYKVHCIHQGLFQWLNDRIFFNKGVELGTTSWGCAALVETDRNVAQMEHSDDS